MKIRKASEVDNDQLLSLARRTPMIGSVSAYTDRAPDFFRFSKLQGNKHVTYVAEEKGTVVGSVTCVSRSVRFGGKTVKQLYGCDLKVVPEARKLQLGKKLSTIWIEEAIKDESYQLGELEVIDDNKRALNIVSWISQELCPSKNAGIVKTYQLMPFRPYRKIKGYAVRRATIEDIPKIARILHETYKNHDCSPLFDDSALEAELEKDESFNIDCFRVAEKEGVVVACAAFWDQSHIRQTVVTTYSTKVQICLAILSVLKAFLPIPPLPKPGRPLKYLYFRLPGSLPGHREALRAILHDESNKLRSLKKYHFIWAGFHQNDPLSKVLCEMWKIDFNVNLFQFDPRRSLGFENKTEEPQRPVYIDLSLI